jgi:hypothetical protein
MQFEVFTQASTLTKGQFQPDARYNTPLLITLKKEETSVQ